MAGEGYIGAGGQRFQSSVLAKASMPGGYTRTISRAPTRQVGGAGVAGLTELFRKQFTESRAENREQRGLGLAELAEVAGLFGPDYGAGIEHAAMAGAEQSLIGRGLGGTTRPMAVGAGMKAQFEDLRRGRLAEALSRMAEYRRTFSDIYPTPGTIASLALGARGGELQEQEMYRQSIGQPIFAAPPYNLGAVTNIPAVDFSLPSTW